MLERGLITDVVLLSFLVPDRRALKLNQAVKIRKSIFKQIGLNCPNLVSERQSYTHKPPLTRIFELGAVGSIKLLSS